MSHFSMTPKKKHIEENEVVIESESDEFENAVSKLKQKLKECEGEKKEYLEGWQKARADLVNLRKKDEEDYKKALTTAAAPIVSDLIDVIDSFEMAFANTERWQQVSEEWRKGVEYI